MQNRLPHNFQIHTLATKEDAIIQLTQTLNSVLQNVHDDNNSFLFLVSGGSAFDLFPHISLDNFSNAATVSVLDERFSRDPKENNFVQFQQTDFYRGVKDKGAQFIDTTIQNEETHKGHAKRFAQALSEWKKNNPGGVIVATVGIGPDGHTSGILPFPENQPLFSELFENPDVLVADYDADGKNPYRYRSTTTNIFLREYIDHAFVYAVGSNKKDALSRVFSDTGNLAETPARVLREMKNIDLFTDVSLE